MSISYSGETPIWNLTETTAYPIEIQSKPVYAYLTPYQPQELKDVLKRAVSGYKRDKRDVEIVREDRAIYTPLCDAHFVKLGNATGTPDEQRAFLDKFSHLKPGIVEFTFGGLQSDLAETDDTDDVLDIALELSGSVKVFQDIYDGTKVVRVKMEHRYAHPTEAQYRQYRNSRRNKFLRKQTLWTVSESHETLESLYDTVVLSVSGVAVNGKACTRETKAEWLSGIPLWHKLWIVDQIFGELVEKNA